MQLIPLALDASVAVTDVSRYPCRTPMVKFSTPSSSRMVRLVFKKPITATEVSRLSCKANT